VYCCVVVVYVTVCRVLCCAKLSEYLLLLMCVCVCVFITCIPAALCKGDIVFSDVCSGLCVCVCVCVYIETNI